MKNWYNENAKNQAWLWRINNFSWKTCKRRKFNFHLQPWSSIWKRRKTRLLNIMTYQNLVTRFLCLWLKKRKIRISTMNIDMLNPQRIRSKFDQKKWQWAKWQKIGVWKVTKSVDSEYSRKNAILISPKWPKSTKTQKLWGQKSVESEDTQTKFQEYIQVPVGMKEIWRQWWARRHWNCTVWKFHDFFYHSDFMWNQFWRFYRHGQPDWKICIREILPFIFYVKSRLSPKINHFSHLSSLIFG